MRWTALWVLLGLALAQSPYPSWDGQGPYTQIYFSPGGLAQAAVIREIE
jgi:hypothetical protein